MKKTLPTLTTDEAAEAFLETADLSHYDLSGMKPNTFEFAAKARQVNMRMSEQLLDAVKAKAAAQGMSYQRFIRQALEAAIGA
ncbi:BrnA antitoxin family protein [Novosphingobium sp.]|uniref:BrnA antitoxin family protein n=1 Tax=Novosphingobium sp. TaxID=1874826 RepID=UPI00333F47F2